MAYRMMVGLLFFALTAVVTESKSTKFRIEKMNYIYDKALQHVKDQQRLKKLESELSGFDRVYMDTKEKTSMGKQSKEDLATVDGKLRVLMEKYDLALVLDAFEKKKATKEAAASGKRDLSDVTFGDEKLQKLWNAAQTSKFARDELEELYSELVELEKKQGALADALADLNETPHHENRVDLEHDRHLKMDEKNKRAKEANRAVHTHYAELHKKVLNEEFSPFQSSKVKKLWQTATSHSNFTSNDLEVIREELIHFDRQLKKLELHKSELEKGRGEEKMEKKSPLQQLEDGEMEAKHERLDRKLKKLEKYLVTKIKHSEL